MKTYPVEQIITQLIQLQQKPAPFTPGAVLFWADPHLPFQLLEVHLNPDVEAARSAYPPG